MSVGRRVGMTREKQQEEGWIWVGQHGYCPICSPVNYDPTVENDRPDLEVDYCCNCGKVNGEDRYISEENR